YNINKDEGILRQNASIVRKDLSIAADSIYFSSPDSLYVARYNVIIKDTSNHLGFRGDYAMSDQKKHFGFVTGHALAQHFGNEDTLYIHADTLFNYLDS